MITRACPTPTLSPDRLPARKFRATLHGVPVRRQRPGGLAVAAWADNPALDLPADMLRRPELAGAEAEQRPAAAMANPAERDVPAEPTAEAPSIPDEAAPPESGDEDVRVLFSRARAGDAEAFGRIYQRYQRTVFGFIYRRVNNPTVAEDLTSEVFVRALRGISRFTWQGRDPVAWLVTIAANLVRDHFRSARQRLEVVSDDAVAGQHRRAQSSEGQPELAAIAAMTNEALREAVATLTPAQQQCIALRFFGGLSTQETAERMGTTARAVVSMQYRAVQALADTMPAMAVTG